MALKVVVVICVLIALVTGQEKPNIILLFADDVSISLDRCAYVSQSALHGLKAFPH